MVWEANMKRRLNVVMVIAAIALMGPWFLPTAALTATKKASHSLFSKNSVPPDTHLICGTRLKDKPYTLHISGRADVSDGTIQLFFRDGDGISFSVLAGSSFSTSQALGGVPEVDTPWIKIATTGGVRSMMASVLSEEGGQVFCVSCTGGPDDLAVCTFP